MDRRITGIVIVLTGLLLLSAVIWVVFFGGLSFGEGVVEEQPQPAPKPAEIPEQVSEPIEVEETQTSPTRITFEDIQNPPDNSEEILTYTKPSQKDTLRHMSEAFAERYGSYSNHSNFTNIVDLQYFMTRKMKDWSNDYIQKQKERQPAVEIYYGITTKAVDVSFEAFDPDVGVAEVVVSTRRVEAAGSMSNRSDTFEQDLEMTFKKEFGAWKVDSAYWSER